MIATFTPNTTSVNPNTDTDACDDYIATLEFVTPNALRCHCAEYHTHHFCLHLVYYTAAKIQAFRESARNTQPKGQSK